VKQEFVALGKVGVAEKMSRVSKKKVLRQRCRVNANYRNVENYLIVGSVRYKNKMRKAVIFLDEAWLQYSDTKILVQFLVSTNFNDYFKLIPKQLCGELTEKETV
jgi:hypothetical protein